jgi:uncharacterized membrane protein
MRISKGGGRLESLSLLFLFYLFLFFPAFLYISLLLLLERYCRAGLLEKRDWAVAIPAAAHR